MRQVSRKRTGLPAGAILAICLVACPASGAPMEAVTLREFTWAADPRISPDGSRVVFVRVTIDHDHDSYAGNLWIVDAAGEHAERLTFSDHDSHPRWSQDGTVLALLRKVARPTKRPSATPETAKPERHAQIFLLPVGGGEARRLTTLSAGVESFAWSPDGTRIVFTSRQREAPTEENIASLLPDPNAHAVVVTRPVFKRDGHAGLIDPLRRRHLWMVPTSGGSPKQLTTGEFDERSPVFSPDGREVYFVSDRRAEPWFGRRDSDVYSIPADGGAIERVFDVGGRLAYPAISRDGQTIVAIGYRTDSDVIRSYDQNDLLLKNHDTVTNLTAAFDFDIGDSIGTDAPAPIARGTEHLRFILNDRRIVTQASRRGRCALVEVDLETQAVRDLVAGDFEVVSWTASRDARRFALIIASPASPGDLYLYDYGSRLRRIVGIGSDALSGITLSRPEEISCDSFDGRRIDGWILKPPAFEVGKKYPMVLQIHGGPHMAYGYGFFQEFHLLAARGFVVLYVNPRGSTSYGQAFGNLVQYDYPGDDYRDLMAGVDHVLAMGFVDETRIGITGGSGGGLLTNWAITQTDRFAAAVTQRCVSDWASFYYTSDLVLFAPTWFRGAPFSNPKEFAARSPITYAAKINTPLMIIHAEDDYRTPISQGEAMFRALSAQRKPVVMVRFPGESHALSRTGKPSLRIERMDHIVNWFEMFLTGRVTDRYGNELQSIAKQRHSATQPATIP